MTFVGEHSRKGLGGLGEDVGEDIGEQPGEQIGEHLGEDLGECDLEKDIGMFPKDVLSASE